MTQKLGLLAGKGDLPKQIIETCEKEGRPFHIIAFFDQTDPELVQGRAHTWLRLGAAGQTIRELKAQSVDTIVMAGRMSRPSMRALRPDAWALKFFAKAGKAAFGDDGLLKTLVHELEKEGFSVIGANDILSDILAPKGVWGQVSPDDQANADIQKGLKIAHEIGRLDIGQGVVVQQGLVIAVEAIEGTDQMLTRVADCQRDGLGGVLVKAKKPQQETRADLPTIGVTTIENAAKAGLRGVAVEAGHTIALNQAAIIEAADRLSLFVIGISADD